MVGLYMHFALLLDMQQAAHVGCFDFQFFI
jgi:hypothetical protein